MVTVAVIGILTSIAYPAYRAYVLRGNRTDAIRALTQAAQILQRCYSQTFTFAGCAPIPPTLPAVELSPNGHYDLSSVLTTAPAVETFTLTATYVGSQTADTTCKTFTLDQTGQQVAKDAGGTDQSTTCWGSN